MSVHYDMLLHCQSIIGMPMLHCSISVIAKLSIESSVIINNTKSDLQQLNADDINKLNVLRPAYCVALHIPHDLCYK